MNDGFTGVVIFDGECPVCSRTAGIIRRIDDVGVVAWSDEASQAFLAAEFDEIPFSMVFVDGEAEVIYVGEAAAKELAERAGAPSMFSTFLKNHYHTMATALQRTVGSGVDPDPTGGRFDLSATDEYAGLLDAAVAVDGDITDAVEPTR